MFNISVLLEVQANLPESSPFFVSPNGFGEHLFSNVYSTWDVQLWSKYTKGCSIKGIISQHLLVPNCAYRNETNEKVTFSRQYELMAVLPKVHTPGEFVEQFH